MDCPLVLRLLVQNTHKLLLPYEDSMLSHPFNVPLVISWQILVPLKTYLYLHIVFSHVAFPHACLYRNDGHIGLGPTQ